MKKFDVKCWLLTGLMVWAMLARKCRGNCAGKTMLRVNGLTCQDKQIIVEEHNRLREWVAQGEIEGQPAAENMMEMFWDDELASVAQQWSEKCIIAHDHARHVQRFAVGQNLALVWTNKAPTYQDYLPDWRTQLHAWFNEVSIYRKGYYQSGSAHYTQIIWAETFLVGCGYSFYYDPSRGYTKLYVCNYGPSGNVQGFLPYVIGQPNCQAYGYTPSDRYTGLCVQRVYYPLGYYCSYY